MSSFLSLAVSAPLKIGLNAVVERHQAIATNIANANSIDFSPLRTDFAYFLERAESGDFGSLAADEGRSTVSIEQSMVSLNENTLRYQILTKLAAKQINGLQTAITGGR